MYERKNLKRIEIGSGSTAVKWFFNIAIAVIIWFAFFSRFSSYLYQINIAFSDLTEVFPDNTPLMFDRTDSWRYFYGFPFVYAYDSFCYDPIGGSNGFSYVWIIVDIVFWVLVVSAITHVVIKNRLMNEEKNLKCTDIGPGNMVAKWFSNIAIAVAMWFAFFSRFSSYLYQINIAFGDLFDRTDSSTYFYGFPFVYAYESFWYEPITGSNEISYFLAYS